MRVDDRNLTGTAASGAGKTAEASQVERHGREDPGARGGSGTDRVELSALGRALNASAASREHRITQLSALHQAGRYAVDPQRVGKALVQEGLQESAGSRK
jgi:anti-sigma28 factor (negative regulator of flagellin synthesis)